MQAFVTHGGRSGRRIELAQPKVDIPSSRQQVINGIAESGQTVLVNDRVGVHKGAVSNLLAALVPVIVVIIDITVLSIQIHVIGTWSIVKAAHMVLGVDVEGVGWRHGRCCTDSVFPDNSTGSSL